ncbi:MAG: NTP transferase domain-containing protein [Planctomycetota bacterium]
MQIVIPLSGMGERFRAAGYTTPKPLLEVEGRTVIDHVVRLFPGADDFVFIVNRWHAEETEILAILGRLVPHARVRVIEPHKRGPVHAVLEAADLIRDDEQVIVNYCDFSAVWDYGHFARSVTESGVAGAIPAYRGFHPHSLGPTLYAYLRESNGRILEVREKQHFTTNRLMEYASSGTYYFASGRLMKLAFREQIARELHLRGEYYVSMSYNLLIEDGLPVSVYELEKFLQWGTPEDWEEYCGWSSYFARHADWQPRQLFGGQVVVPMAGRGERFRAAGYTTSKPLIDVGGVPMVIRAARSLPRAERAVFVARSEDLRDGALAALLSASLPCEAIVVPVDYETAGQAATCLIACRALDPALPLMIGPCDSAIVWEEDAFAALVRDPSIDCIVFTFRGHPHAARHPESYGWIVPGRGSRIDRVSIKTPVSAQPARDHGIVGAFWFRRTADFQCAADRMMAAEHRVNGEYYVDTCIAHALEAGLNVHFLDVTHYLCWGTPDDLRTYQYWEEYFASASHHPYERTSASHIELPEAALV